MYITELIEKFETKNCVSCGEKLKPISEDEEENTSTIKHYDHDHGLIIKRCVEPQWVYVVCNNCGYQCSWKKLGVDRGGEIMTEEEGGRDILNELRMSFNKLKRQDKEPELILLSTDYYEEMREMTERYTKLFTEPYIEYNQTPVLKVSQLEESSIKILTKEDLDIVRENKNAQV